MLRRRRSESQRNRRRRRRRRQRQRPRILRQNRRKCRVQFESRESETKAEVAGSEAEDHNSEEVHHGKSIQLFLKTTIRGNKIKI